MAAAVPRAVVFALNVIDVLERICVMVAFAGIPAPVTRMPIAMFAVLVRPVTLAEPEAAHEPVCPAHPVK